MGLNQALKQGFIEVLKGIIVSEKGGDTWSAPTEWSKLIVSAWLASGLLA